MAAQMWRQVVGQVHRSGSAVIEDKGHLRGAVTASDGYFWFSEVGAGVQALVLIFSSVGIVGLFLGDVLMAMVDPRIKHDKGEGAR